MNTYYLEDTVSSQHEEQIAGQSFHDVDYLTNSAVVARLVNNLKYYSNIQSGDHLTFVLGYGECNSNDEALKRWVLSQLESLQASLTYEQVFSFLKDALRSKLALDVDEPL